MRLLALALPIALLLPACVHPAPLAPQAVALNRDGAAAMAQGDWVTAEARIALALEYNPRFTEAWVNLGYVDMLTGHEERARRDFVRARDLNPDLATPHHALGVLSDRQGRFADAERYYRAALHVDPGFAPARVNLVRRLFERGELDEAREHALRLTQVAPEVIEGWTFLGETLLKMNRLEDAGTVLASARLLHPRSPALGLLDARVLVAHGRYGEAGVALEPLTRTGDREVAAMALAWRAIAAMGAQDPEAAERFVSEAGRLAPDNDVVRYARAALVIEPEKTQR